MANNYYQGTGVLVLSKVTPVIDALFRPFHLDADYPGNGSAYIARLAEDENPQWEDIRQNLSALAAELNRPSHLDLTIRHALFLLADHFIPLNHPKAMQVVAERFTDLVNHHDFDSEPDLETLFQLACYFDDGHGLDAIEFEGALTCDKPRLGGFGGDSLYISREVVLASATTPVLTLGSKLQQAMVINDLSQATTLFTAHANELLSSITDPVKRKTISELLAIRLS